MNTEEEIMLRLSKQRIPLLIEKKKLKEEWRNTGKKIRQIGQKLYALDSEIVQLSAKLIR